MGRKKAGGRTPLSSFRFTLQELEGIDTVAAKLAEPTGGKPNRADAIRYGVRLALMSVTAGSSAPVLPKSIETHPPIPPQSFEVPLLGVIAAGDGTDGPAEPNTWVKLPEKCRHADGAYIVRGSSMRGAGIQPGDILYVRKTDQPASGETVIAFVQDRGMVVKRLKRKGPKCFLYSADGESDDGQDPYQMGTRDSFHGVVVGLVRDYAEPPAKERRTAKGS